MKEKRKAEKVNDNALAIFIKNPILGKAKTRIAKDSSDKKALEIYKNLLSITRGISEQVDCKKYVFYDQFIDEGDDWSNANFDKKLQKGNDLGERMLAAFIMLENENIKKTVLIGSDCPYISPALIQEAFDSLDKHDFVLGPTLDGGYYLIGMKKASEVVFSNIEWSQETVLENTLERILEIDCSYFLLERLNDIDHLADWHEYSSHLN